jgi:hypothetical protein
MNQQNNGPLKAIMRIIIPALLLILICSFGFADRLPNQTEAVFIDTIYHVNESVSYMEITSADRVIVSLPENVTNREHWNVTPPYGIWIISDTYREPDENENTSKTERFREWFLTPHQLGNLTFSATLIPGPDNQSQIIPEYSRYNLTIQVRYSGHSYQ